MSTSSSLATRRTAGDASVLLAGVGVGTVVVDVEDGDGGGDNGGGGGGAADCLLGCGAPAVDDDGASTAMSHSGAPTATTSPACACFLTSVPFDLLVISMVALSLCTSTSFPNSTMRSPSSANHCTTSHSAIPSPVCGSGNVSITALVDADDDEAAAAAALNPRFELWWSFSRCPRRLVSPGRFTTRKGVP